MILICRRSCRLDLSKRKRTSIGRTTACSDKFGTFLFSVHLQFSVKYVCGYHDGFGLLRTEILHSFPHVAVRLRTLPYGTVGQRDRSGSYIPAYPQLPLSFTRDLFKEMFSKSNYLAKKSQSLWAITRIGAAQWPCRAHRHLPRCFNLYDYRQDQFITTHDRKPCSRRTRDSRVECANLRKELATLALFHRINL